MCSGSKRTISTRRNTPRRASRPQTPRSPGSRSWTGEEWVREDTAERLRGLYGFRRNRFLSRFDENDDGAIEEQSLNYQRLRRELFDAERAAIVDLRRRGVIDDEVERRLYRELDLEDARLEV